MGKGGSVSVQGGNVMSEEAPVNTGAVAWPDDYGWCGGTEDADQVAPLGDRRSWSPVR